MAKKSKKKTKKKKEEKSLRVNIDSGGPGFFSDFITVFHNPRNFILDFQQATPRYTRIGSENPQQTMYVRHNSVIINPQVAKQLLKILKENVEKYEKKFGQIEMPKKQSKKKAKESKKADHTKSYIG